jgi:hypothetical protein
MLPVRKFIEPADMPLAATPAMARGLSRRGSNSLFYYSPW